MGRDDIRESDELTKREEYIAMAGYANTMQEQHTQKNVSIEKRNGANHAYNAITQVET